MMDCSWRCARPAAKIAILRFTFGSELAPPGRCRGWARPGVAKAESEEVKDLRRRNWLLEQENEVLRRAAAYLSQANLRLGQSPKRCSRWSWTLPPTGSPSR